MRRLAPAYLGLCIFAAGCKMTGSNYGSDIAASSQPQLGSSSSAKQKSILPPPALNGKAKLTTQQVDYIVAAMLDAHKAFYETGSGYMQTPSGQRVPSVTEVSQCMSVGLSTGRWSMLMAHYYALFPAYASGFFPNIRECFSMLVSPNTQNKIAGVKPSYPEAYDYCTYMPIDRQGVSDTGALYNWAQVNPAAPAMIPANKANDHAVGPFAWIHKNQEDVFQFIMFGGLCGVETQSQQAVLDKFIAGLPIGSALKATKPMANACP